jgi:hypothetical protein
MNAERCLVEGILSSIVEPVFVPARERVYSGLEGPQGEKGTWLDGSIRSLNPAARAAGFSAGKVFVLSTNRAEGIVAAPPAGALPLLLSTFDALGASQRAWEIGFASLYQHQREERFCEIGRLMGNPSLCAKPADEDPKTAPSAKTAADAKVAADAKADEDAKADAAAATSKSLSTDGLMAVWVPEDVRPKALFASGYTFDPIVMRGLFLWGQKEFFRSRDRVHEWLYWCALPAMEGKAVECPAPGASPRFAEELKRRAEEIDVALKDYDRYENRRVWQDHVNQRRHVVEMRMGTCK